MLIPANLPNAVTIHIFRPSHGHHYFLCSDCPAFWRHKSTMIHPDNLEALGIDVHTTVQTEGEAVVIFPYVYHSGCDALRTSSLRPGPSCTTHTVLLHHTPVQSEVP